MKIMNVQIRPFVQRLLYRRLTFKQTIYASLFFHVLLFCIVSAVVSLFEHPGVTNPPLVFDFAFMPTDDGNFSGRALQSQNETTQELTKKERPTPEIHEKLNSRQKESFAAAEKSISKPPVRNQKLENERLSNTEFVQPPKAQNEQIDSGEESTREDKPAYIPQDELKLESLSVKSFATTSFSVPGSGAPHALTFDAEIAMTKKQKRMLKKKLKKWAENMARMDFSNPTMVWDYKGEKYSAHFYRKPASDDMGIDEMLVQVKTEEDGVAMSTTMRMKRLAFSSFAQFVDYWDPWVALHNDQLEGRFHANSVINIDRSGKIAPKFYGKVTTASYEVKTSDSNPFFNEKSVFLGGLETGVKAIHLPRDFLPFLSDSTLSDEQCLHCNEDMQVTFYRNGTVGWRSLRRAGKEHNVKIPDRPFYVLGTKKKELHLKGVVKGKVLVYSPGKIIIDDDLTYARHPEVSLVADDYLGIVSDKNVEIANPSVTGPGDLSIFASIYAKKRFVVKNRKGKGDATLFIYGSLTAGSLSATEPRYATKVLFDKRLEQRRPPNFPMTDRYEVIGWNKNWKVEGTGTQ